MAEVLCIAIAQAFSITGTQSASVTDDDGTRVVDFNAAGTTWARVGLAPGSGAGTEADPVEFLKHVQDTINGGGTLWTLKLRSDGRVRVIYTGTTVNGEVVWTGDVPTILGNLPNLDVAPASEALSPAQPTHIVYGTASGADNGWQRVSSRFAGAAMADGQVYGWGDGLVALERRVSLHLHPKDNATRLAAGFPDAMPGTPMFPDVVARWQRPGALEPAQPPPWSVLDFLGTCGGRSLGMAWGTFQDIVGGTSSTYDTGFLAPDAVRGAKPAPSVAFYDARWTVPDVVFTFTGQGSTA